MVIEKGEAPESSTRRRRDPGSTRSRGLRGLQHVVPASAVLTEAWTRMHCSARSVFCAARNIEEGGSLTILATALIDTGSA